MSFGKIEITKLYHTFPNIQYSVIVNCQSLDCFINTIWTTVSSRHEFYTGFMRWAYGGCICMELFMSYMTFL